MIVVYFSEISQDVMYLGTVATVLYKCFAFDPFVIKLSIQQLLPIDV